MFDRRSLINVALKIRTRFHGDRLIRFRDILHTVSKNLVSREKRVENRWNFINYVSPDYPAPGDVITASCNLSQLDNSLMLFSISLRRLIKFYKLWVEVFHAVGDVTTSCYNLSVVNSLMLLETYRFWRLIEFYKLQVAWLSRARWRHNILRQFCRLLIGQNDSFGTNFNQSRAFLQICNSLASKQKEIRFFFFVPNVRDLVENLYQRVLRYNYSITVVKSRFFHNANKI